MFAPYAEWRPDVAKFPLGRGAPFASEAKNVVPDADGYRPFLDAAANGDALAAAPLGAAGLINKSATPKIYAGTATALYDRQADGSWSDVTRSSGGAYTAADEQRWRFCTFGDYAIATDYADAPQYIDMTSGSNFANISGSPPRARYCVAYDEFLFLLATQNSEAQVWWSAVGDITGWTPGTNLSGNQILGDGGPIRGAYVADALYIAQQQAWTRCQFIGDGQYVMSFDKIEGARGCVAAGSMVPVGRVCYYLSEDGFMMFDGVQSVPIGEGKVDRWFLDLFSRAFTERVSGAYNHVDNCVYWSFMSTSATDDPDYVIIYNTMTRAWSYAVKSLSMVFQGQSLSYTLEDLDSLFATLEDVTPSLDAQLWQGGIPLLAALDTDKKFASFEGAALAATLETGDIEPDAARRTFWRHARPQDDAADGSVTLGVRQRAQNAISWLTAKSVNSFGQALIRRNARIGRIRRSIDAGSTWTRARGVDLMIEAAGGR